MYNWKFVPSAGGHWEFIPGSDPNDKTKGNYVWVATSPANQYSLQILINGKFWALSSTADANPILAQVSGSDVYQKWDVEAQADGFYKITNAGLRNACYPNANLFADNMAKQLFIGKWDEATSLNGRWHLIMAGPINQSDGKGKFDDRRMIISPVSMNKNMCLKYLMTSDATGEYLISPCDNNTPDRFEFQKTITGYYFIKVETNQNGQVYSFYLDNQLKTRRLDEFDILNPDINDTWNVSDLGNGLFMLSASATGMVFEMVKGYYRNTGPGGWASSMPDHVELRRWEGKYEQQWFLRE